MSQTESKKMFMDGKLYNAAVESKTDVLMEEQAHLDRLLTPRSNNILHIHILARPPNTESTQFLQWVLEMCPSLLFQANTKGEIPLHIAAKYGHDDVIKVLIKREKLQGHHQLSDLIAGYKQQMLWVTNNEKDTALHEAVRMNHLDVVRLLIAEDPEYSYSGNAGSETPLYLAVERGYNDIAYEILERCQSPAHGGPHGRTTLHAAVIREDLEMTKRILMKTWPTYALTRKVDEEGWTPLHYSTQNKYMEVFLMLLELDKSAAYIASNDKRWTPLHVAIRTGSTNMVKELILQCPDCVELVDHQGWNILHHAIDKYDVQDLSAFLQNSVASKLLNGKDAHGNTPVHQIASTSCGHKLYSAAFFAQAPLVDKNALNGIDQTPLDILLEDVDQSANVTSEKKTFTKKMKERGFKQSMQNKIEGQKPVKSQNEGRSWDEEEALKKRIKKLRVQDLRTATITAAVTFAAFFSFLLPDDYNCDEGHHQGWEVFSRKTAFQAFLICHTTAMAYSIVYRYTRMPPEEGKNRFTSSILACYLLSIIAMGALVLAFAAAAFALLSLSELLNISIILINSLLHYFNGYMNNFSQRF